MSHTINELVILRNMGFFIKQLAERECGYKYSEIPINRENMKMIMKQIKMPVIG